MQQLLLLLLQGSLLGAAGPCCCCRHQPWEAPTGAAAAAAAATQLPAVAEEKLHGACRPVLLLPAILSNPPQGGAATAGCPAMPLLHPSKGSCLSPPVVEGGAGGLAGGGSTREQLLLPTLLPLHGRGWQRRAGRGSCHPCCPCHPRPPLQGPPASLLLQPSRGNAASNLAFSGRQ